jgi:hypothetical protein
MGDDVPHPPEYPQNKKKLDWRQEAKALGEEGVMVYGVQCLNRSYATHFYREISGQAAGGQHLQLGTFDTMPELFVGVCLKQASDELFEDYSKQVVASGRMSAQTQQVFASLRNVVVVRRVVTVTEIAVSGGGCGGGGGAFSALSLDEGMSALMIETGASKGKSGKGKSGKGKGGKGKGGKGKGGKGKGGKGKGKGGKGGKGKGKGKGKGS